jgi:hypothetical protein
MERITFIGCHANNFTNLGYHLENPGPPSYPSGVWVSHIRFISCTAEAYNGPGTSVLWIYLVNGAGAMVDDVTFDNCYGDGNGQAYYGMQIYATNFKVINNMITYCTGTGIAIDNGYPSFSNGTCHNGVVSGNIVYNMTYNGIILANNPANITLVGNNVRDCGANNYSVSGTGNIYGDNLGWPSPSSSITHECGQVTMLIGQTNITVNHTLGVRPTCVLITPNNQFYGNGTVMIYWVNYNYVTTTQFRIDLGSAVSYYDCIFYWYVEV